MEEYGESVVGEFFGCRMGRRVGGRCLVRRLFLGFI